MTHGHERVVNEKRLQMKEKRRNVICLVTNIFEEDFINSLTEDERRNMQYIRQDTILFNDPQKRERQGYTEQSRNDPDVGIIRCGPYYVRVCVSLMKELKRPYGY